jgi:uncharacterized protein
VPVKYEQFGQRYIVRIESGDNAIELLTRFLEQQRIEFANLSAAGAVSSVRLGYWNAGRHEYEFRELNEQMEVVSFQGNAALKDGSPFLHLHGAFAREDFSVIGGHIKEARVHPTLEVWLRVEDVAVRRARDAETGLDLLDLPTRDRDKRSPSLTAAPEGLVPDLRPQT